MSKPILCLDFDGVIHSYTSGWQGADVVADDPVPGAAEFIIDAIEFFDVAVYSSRTHQEGGLEAMQEYLARALAAGAGVDLADASRIVLDVIKWPTTKPPAFLSIDDRALTFTGHWYEPSDLLRFVPWYKTEQAVAREEKVASERDEIYLSVTYAVAQGWQEPETSNKEMDSVLAEAIIGRVLPVVRAWSDTALLHHKNEDYYRALVEQIGAMLGDEAFIADDGFRHDSVLCAKVPELVAKRLAGVS